MLSGALFFADLAPAGQPVILYSAIYNATYMVPSTIICAAAAALILPALRNVGVQERPPAPVSA